MKIVKDKYRGTTTYVHVLAELVRAAQYRGVTTYSDIAVIMGLRSTGNQMSKELGQILGEISEDEAACGRPMLSAVAVSAAGKLGDGFYNLARDLGKLQPGADEISFWRTEVEAVYREWKRPLPVQNKVKDAA